jgi:hypothetical protein
MVPPVGGKWKEEGTGDIKVRPRTLGGSAATAGAAAAASARARVRACAPARVRAPLAR